MIQPLPKATVSVLLAHHSALDCKLLVEALRGEASFQFARCDAEAPEIVRALHGFKAEVVVLAVPGSGERTCGIVRTVHRKHPNCKQVILLSERQRAVLPELFRLGARGVINIETAEIEMICKCILQVSQGHFWLSSRELDIVLQEFAKSCSLRVVNRNGQKLLSRREMEVVMLLAEGMTNRDIADELRISPFTVRNYLSQIFDKVGASTRTELVRFAFAFSAAEPAPLGIEQRQPQSSRR